MVDYVGQNPPKLQRDDHWDICVPDELPYTVASLAFRYYLHTYFSVSNKHAAKPYCFLGIFHPTRPYSILHVY